MNGVTPSAGAWYSATSSVGQRLPRPGQDDLGAVGGRVEPRAERPTPGGGHGAERRRPPPRWSGTLAGRVATAHRRRPRRSTPRDPSRWRVGPTSGPPVHGGRRRRRRLRRSRARRAQNPPTPATAAARPITPNSAMPAVAQPRCRRDSTPRTAAKINRTTSTEPMSTGLSFVPKVSMANVLSHEGAASITRLPTWLIGEEKRRASPATSSAAPRAATAVTSPMTMPRPGWLRCARGWFGGDGGRMVRRARDLAHRVVTLTVQGAIGGTSDRRRSGWPAS